MQFKSFFNILKGHDIGYYGLEIQLGQQIKGTGKGIGRDEYGANIQLSGKHHKRVNRDFGIQGIDSSQDDSAPRSCQ